MGCLTFLGLCRRAGKLCVGDESCRTAVMDGKARLLMFASDTKARRFIAPDGSETKAPSITLPFTKSEIGAAIGKADPGVLAVTDIGFAAAFAEKLSAEAPGKYDDALAKLRETKARIDRRKSKTKKTRGRK